MTSLRRTSLTLLAVLGLLAPECAAATTPDLPWQFWRPLEAELLAAKTPVVDKDADAEAVFWRVWVEDEVVGGEDPQAVLKHYLRIKVFTARGIEAQSHVDLTYGNKRQITEISGRTIKPDGTIAELKKSDIFERTLVKADGVKLKARSFVLPGVELGAVIEYRWKEYRVDQLANYVRLHLQRDIPVQQVTYFLKPFRHPMFPYDMRLQAFQIELARAQASKAPNGYTRLHFEGIPAFKPEPHAPPEDQIRSWLLVYYAPFSEVTQEKFWKDQGKAAFKSAQDLMKADADVTLAVADALQGEQAPERKIERIHDYCRTRIKRLDDDASGLTSEARAKLKPSRSPGETIRRGGGIRRDVNLLFGALAQAAGFEVRVGLLSDRSDVFFDPHFLDDYFLTDWLVAVKLAGEWRFFDPASTYVPFGMLHWTNEGVPALVADAPESRFVQTPISATDKSRAKRHATFKLSADGTLEGDVRVEYTGHLAAELKERHDAESVEEREKALRDGMQKLLSTAELTDALIENVTMPEGPFVESYKVRVPGYGQRTGRRLFFQPAYFQRGRSAPFPQNQRVHPVYFDFPWSEEDDVSIELPAGFELESADVPAPLSAGPVCDHRIKMSMTNGRQLAYKRQFFFGGGGRIMFPIDLYATLKEYFDAVHAADDHTLTLKQANP